MKRRIESALMAAAIVLLLCVGIFQQVQIADLRSEQAQLVQSLVTLADAEKKNSESIDYNADAIRRIIRQMEIK